MVILMAYITGMKYDIRNQASALATRTGLLHHLTPSPLLHNIQVMVIVWRLRGNIIRTALCWIVRHKMSAAHLYEQFLQVQQIGFVTLGPLHCA